MSDSTNIVFPHYSNLNYRNGWVKLSALENEWEEAVADENFEAVYNRLTQSHRKKEKDFEGSTVEYLDNIITNVKKDRASQSGKVKFMCILPLPLLFNDTTSVTWGSTSSAFNDVVFSSLTNGKIGNIANTISATAENRGKDENGNMSTLGVYAQKGADFISNYTGKTNNPLTSQVIGSYDVTQSLRTTMYAQQFGKPGKHLSKLVAEASDVNMVTAFKEAAAINGKRQIIFNPGYWQNFQGVNPRSFTLTWDIIPENHDDAVNGLALCSRIREYSLPQSVSGVELLSPCYWQIDWFSDYLTAQTLYSNLVITNVSYKFSEDGEWHTSMTPKLFHIEITFEEAKAPTNDIYKANYEPYEQSVANNGSSANNGNNGG